MKIVFIVSCIIICNLHEGQCGLLHGFLDLFQDEVPSTTTSAPRIITTVKTKRVSLERTVFETAPRLQALFEPNDERAKINYIISPLGVISLLGQMLIGTHGAFHNYISDFLDLTPPRCKRDMQVIELTRDKLYDQKLYHSAFHWKFRLRVHQIKKPKEDYEMLFRNALMYDHQKDEVIEHFKKYVEEFYNSELLDVNFNQPNNNILSQWTNFMDLNESGTNPLLSNHINGQAVLFNRFEFKSSWDVPLIESTKEEPFAIKPYQYVKVKYLQGTIRNTLYVQDEQFTVAVIPLKNEVTNMYIVLPNDVYAIRVFSESMHDFETFKDLIENRPGGYRDVNIKIPKIFPYKSEFDLAKPIINDLKTRGHNTAPYILLNGASNQLLVTNVISQLSLTIENEEIKEDMANLNETRENDLQDTEEESTEEMDEEESNEETDSENMPKQEPKPAVDLDVVKPFLFFLVHETTKTILVWGSISDPSQFYSETSSKIPTIPK